MIIRSILNQLLTQWHTESGFPEAGICFKGIEGDQSLTFFNVLYASRRIGERMAKFNIIAQNQTQRFFKSQTIGFL
jgi:hypothetical protein